MARTTQPVEIRSFVAGLVTDASPLTFPDNASLSEENFTLNRDGSRDRRFGIDYEDGYQVLGTDQANISTADIGRSSYRWENVGGNPDLAFLVVQIGQQVDILDLNSFPVSGNRLLTLNFPSKVTDTFSYTDIDGLLIIVNGTQEISVISYDFVEAQFVQEDLRITVRDFFGVQDIVDDEDLMEGGGILERPDVLTQKHTYNLRNQGWTVPRLDKNEEVVRDTIEIFRNNANTTYPSNADLVSLGLFSDPADEDDRIVQRYWPRETILNPIGTTRAPQGYHLIDLFNRGVSRLAEVQKSYDRHVELRFPIEELNTDSTNGGINTVTEFAGRAWFGGFDGEVVDGDDRSPRLSSYLAFSKLVDNPRDIARCYQQSDPTSTEDSSLVDTDGGFIRIDGAYGIKGLVNVGARLIVLAQNGVWYVEGDDNAGFTATSYRVSKLSTNGCRSKLSIVVVENTVMYWGEDGVYHVTTNQFGDPEVQSLTQNSVQNFYLQIDNTSKDIADGHYDTYERKVRWVYNTSLNSAEEVGELILDLNLQAWYINKIKNVDGFVNKPVSVAAGNAYQINPAQENIAAGASGLVIVGGEQAVINLGGLVPIARELIYLTIVNTAPTLSYTFSIFRNTSFLDWQSSDGVGADAAAFLVTGYISGGDFYRDKQLRYLQCYFEKTERLFETSGDDFVLVDPSSCLVSSRWSWANSDAGGKWSKPREFYRFPRHLLLNGTEDIFDDGKSVIISKDKVRGFGKVMSLKFETQPGKNCKLQGWSMVISVEGD